jgi:hypothetical protein
MRTIIATLAKKLAIAGILLASVSHGWAQRGDLPSVSMAEECRAQVTSMMRLYQRPKYLPDDAALERAVKALENAMGSTYGSCMLLYGYRLRTDVYYCTHQADAQVDPACYTPIQNAPR